jgi:hypothetical protein
LTVDVGILAFTSSSNPVKSSVLSSDGNIFWSVHQVDLLPPVHFDPVFFDQSVLGALVPGALFNGITVQNFGAVDPGMFIIAHHGFTTNFFQVVSGVADLVL